MEGSTVAVGGDSDESQRYIGEWSEVFVLHVTSREENKLLCILRASIILGFIASLPVL